MTEQDLIQFRGQAAQAAADATIPEGRRFADAQHPQGYPKPNEHTPEAPLWFVTFTNGDPQRANHYALLRSRDYGGAREEAFNRFGRAWAFIYDITELPAQVSAYGIREWRDE
jgi:hypothetical protein